MNNLDQQIATLTTSVTNLSSAADAAVTLINGIKQSIADAVAAALAAGATPAELQAITDLGTKLDAETTALANAIAANTPAPAQAKVKSVKPK